MRISKSLLTLALAATAVQLSAQGPAPAPAPVEGLYQSQMMEVGSQLALARNGRFLWFFSTGALDLMAEGRWTREADGSVLLNSDPPVTPPRFELVGHGRDSAPGVAIRLACDTGQSQQYLDAIVEYADGRRETFNFQDYAFRTESDPARVPAAIYVGSGAFDLLSERVPVTPGGDNVFTFRFIPNDIGRAEFHDARAAIANRSLSLTWRGTPLRYVRQTTAGFNPGDELPRLPRSPGSGEDQTPAAIQIAIGEPLAGLQARAANALTEVPGEGLLLARGPIDLQLDYNGHRIDVGRVEGGRQRLSVAGDDGGAAQRVGSLAFSQGPGSMPLQEALSQAQALKRQLEAAGFGLLPGAERMGDPAPFTTRPADGGEGVHAADWADAARMLADEAGGITDMSLYTLRTNSHLVSVSLENVRRHEREICAHSDWSGRDGREWRLQVMISPSLAPVPE